MSCSTEVPLSVVIVTWNRPSYVRNCLAALSQQNPAPREIVVVDASVGAETGQIASEWPSVTYVPFPRGAGHMTTARNEGLRHVSGDIIAFIDDDANVRPGWAAALCWAFQNERVGAVGGRTCNGDPDEQVRGMDQIGRLLPNGRLTGNFAAQPPSLVDIDHGIGANMAFRRQILAQLGGFRDDYPGTALREDTDIFFRTRALGYRAVFVPGAVADHVGAPHVKGSRFDWRYQFYAVHNHAMLLVRFRGLTSPMTLRWMLGTVVDTCRSVRPRCTRSYARPFLCVVALSVGTTTAVLRRSSRVILRQDAIGRSLRELLWTSPVPVPANAETG